MCSSCKRDSTINRGSCERPDCTAAPTARGCSLSRLTLLSRRDNKNRSMIIAFACGETRQIFLGQGSRRLPFEIQNTARRKLEYLHRARTLADLRMPPENRLEGLKGDRIGQHSIRINDQWRICFEWADGNARAVEIVDYH